MKTRTVFVQSLGNVKIKFISHNDYKKILALLDSQLPTAEFVAKVIFNQIIDPKIDFLELFTLPTNQFQIIAKALIQNEPDIFNNFSESNKFNEDFKKAIISYNLHIQQEIKASINSLLVIRSSLSSFESEFSNILQQSLEEQSIIFSSLANLQDFTEQISEIKGGFSEIAKSLILQYTNFAEIITKSLTPQINIWERWTQANSGLFANFKNYWKEFEVNYAIVETSAIEVLQKYKWFITPNIPISLVYDIHNISIKEGRQDKEINKIFFQYFSENNWIMTEEFAERWYDNPTFSKRKKILSDCINTIQQSSNKNVNYVNVVLPTLITQIDGLISDFLIYKGISWDKQYDDWIDNQTGIVKKTGRKTQIYNNSPQIMTTSLDDLAHNIFLNILFQKSQIGKPLKTPFNFNRHKIIHGENTNFGRKDYLIRTLLVLDFLSCFY